ncbi:MAG: hypothetical protein ACOX19_01575 [Fermentimonas sp.]|jgi:putative hydrolase of the HAD superfamily
MRYRDLFIDLDDTLWDIHRNGKECLEAIFVDYGYRKYYPEFEGYYNVYMRNNNQLWGRTVAASTRYGSTLPGKFLLG